MRILITAAAFALIVAAPAHAARDSLPKLVEIDETNEYADWPPGALQRGLEGKAVLDCEVSVEGRAENCKVVSDTPHGEGFGAAAIRVTRRYRFEPGRKNGKPVRASARLPIVFNLPLDAEPDWLRKPGSDDLQAAWPVDAARKGVGGKAVLQCVVSVRGTLEGCESVWEDPPGMGFGEAALLLTPSFLLKPGTRGGKPVSTHVKIPIAFESGGVFAGTAVKMITAPVWTSAPTFADVEAAWPAKAKAPFGHVAMRCGVARDGGLRNCEVLTENPVGQGFGKAARGLIPKFRLRFEGELPPEFARAKINLPLRLFNPAAATPRAITEPKWITRLNPEKIAAVYPEAAVQAGVKSGRGVANCLVAADGRLTDCRPAAANPEGLGFSEAAVEVAKVMVMNPWSDGGGPVDGVRIKLPVTFKLAPDQEASPKP